MDRIRDQYADKLAHVLEAQLEIMGKEDDKALLYEHFLGVDANTASNLIQKITLGLPDIIVEADPRQTKQIQLDIVDSFILFMIQETTATQGTFGQTLEEFIHHLVGEIVEENANYFRGRNEIH